MNRKEFIKGIGLVAGAAIAVRAKAVGDTPCNRGSTGGAACSLPNRVLGSGRAAMSVSTLGFGCMGLTYNRSQHPDKKQMSRLLARAVDCGVTLFDTAIVYGPLENELFVGEALAPYKGRINITTKFGHEIVDGKATGRQTSRPDVVRRYCEESLRRLRLDSIPLFYQHRFDRDTPIEDVAGCIADLIREGKVQRWGLCEVSADIIRRAHAVCPLTAIQSEYHLMHRLVEKNGVLDVCRELGIGFVPYSPINRGFLGGDINEYTQFDPSERQSPDASALPAGGAAPQHAHRERAAEVWAHARHDVRAGGARVASRQSAVRRPDSRHDETGAPLREPAHA